MQRRRRASGARSCSGGGEHAAANGGPANSYRMVLLDPVEGRWASLPVLPGPTRSLPLFCQVAAVDGRQGRKRLVIVGGWDPESWVPTNSVYVYDFLTGAWRRGAARGARARAVPVFVAGGHDEEKNALWSALAYDPDVDAWTVLSDMAEERDEPRGLCVGGKFLVVGGYQTPAQGHFAGSAEAFDPATGAWALVEEALLEDGKPASWARTPAPPEFSGHVQAACLLEL